MSAYALQHSGQAIRPKSSGKFHLDLATFTDAPETKKQARKQAISGKRVIRAVGVDFDPAALAQLLRTLRQDPYVDNPQKVRVQGSGKMSRQSQAVLSWACSAAQVCGVVGKVDGQPLAKTAKRNMLLQLHRAGPASVMSAAEVAKLDRMVANALAKQAPGKNAHKAAPGAKRLKAKGRNAAAAVQAGVAPAFVSAGLMSEAEHTTELAPGQLAVTMPKHTAFAVADLAAAAPQFDEPMACPFATHVYTREIDDDASVPGAQIAVAPAPGGGSAHRSNAQLPNLGGLANVRAHAADEALGTPAGAAAAAPCDASAASAVPPSAEALPKLQAVQQSQQKRCKQAVSEDGQHAGAPDDLAMSALALRARTPSPSQLAGDEAMVSRQGSDPADPLPAPPPRPSVPPPPSQNTVELPAPAHIVPQAGQTTIAPADASAAPPASPAPPPLLAGLPPPRHEVVSLLSDSDASDARQNDGEPESDSDDVEIVGEGAAPVPPQPLFELDVGFALRMPPPPPPLATAPLFPPQPPPPRPLPVRVVSYAVSRSCTGEAA